jgi:hypothetical protein
MEEIKLHISQIFQILEKINGNEASPGLLDLDLSVSERFWMNDLNDQIRKIHGAVQNLRDDIVRRRGKPGPDGNVTLKATEKVIIEFRGEQKESIAYTEEFLRFQREYEELLEEVVRIDINEKIFHLLPEDLLTETGLG